MKPFPLEILIRVQALKLDRLKRDVAMIRSDLRLLEEKGGECNRQRELLLEAIISKRAKGDLTKERYFDNYLLFLRKELRELEGQKMRKAEELAKGQQEILSVLQRQKQFEKLKLRWKQNTHEPEL